MGSSGINAPRSNRERPPTPVLDAPPQKTDKFGEFPKPPSNGYSIEVKPLPKIRLDLMPAPREEDEDEHSSASRVTRDSRKQRLLERKRRTSIAPPVASPETPGSNVC